MDGAGLAGVSEVGGGWRVTVAAGGSGAPGGAWSRSNFCCNRVVAEFLIARRSGLGSVLPAKHAGGASLANAIAFV